MRIAIASGKGGTGKTIVATNPAATLAENDSPVTYLDCDVEAPNGHIFLKPEITHRETVTIPVPEVDEANARAASCGGRLPGGGASGPIHAAASRGFQWNAGHVAFRHHGHPPHGGVARGQRGRRDAGVLALLAKGEYPDRAGRVGQRSVTNSVPGRALGRITEAACRAEKHPGFPIR